MSAAFVGATPFYFGAAEAPLFGACHSPGESRQKSTAVVLCNPIGDDLTRAHRALRHLAEKLSSAGFPVLRFDYHGTGDSSGDERDPDRVKTWTSNIVSAIGELRARSGAMHVALVGLRLGGTLAMMAAAEQGGVDSLILWGAYESGGAFVNDVTKAHKLHTLLEPQAFSGGPKAIGGEEALGFFLSNKVIQDLRGVDALAIARRPARRALVIGTGNVPSESRLVEHLTGLGMEVAHKHVPGNRFLITTPHNATVPHETIDDIVGWLSDSQPTSTRSFAALGDTGDALLFRAESADPPRSEQANPIARAQPTSHSWEERPFVFGLQHPLFGILHNATREPLRRDAGLPGVILLNAGCVHRIGAHRLYVPLARRWAQLGFDVLRMDLSGIGDSPAADGCGENLTYPRDGMRDVEEAMAFMRRETGRESFILVGLCSGADLAFKLGFKGGAVAGVVMMNPRTFCVHDLGMVAAYEQARFYQDSVVRDASWKKLLHGEVDIARIFRTLAPKLKDVALTKAKRALQALGRRAVNAQRNNDVPFCLRAMAEKGVDTFLLVADHDPGVDYVDANYKRTMTALHAIPGFRRVDLQGTDHTFTAIWAQERVNDLVTEHFRRRYLDIEPQ